MWYDFKPQCQGRRRASAWRRLIAYAIGVDFIRQQRYNGEHAGSRIGGVFSKHSRSAGSLRTT